MPRSARGGVEPRTAQEDTTSRSAEGDAEPGSASRVSVPALTRARARLVEAAREIRRFARGILGSDAYDVYLAHHRRTGCGGEPLTEKQFWRAKYAAQDVSPEGRCC